MEKKVVSNHFCRKKKHTPMIKNAHDTLTYLMNKNAHDTLTWYTPIIKSFGYVHYCGKKEITMNVDKY